MFASQRNVGQGLGDAVRHYLSNWASSTLILPYLIERGGRNDGSF